MVEAGVDERTMVEAVVRERKAVWVGRKEGRKAGRLGREAYTSVIETQ